MESNYWTFSTLAYVWEYRNRAIVAGGDRLDALAEPERQRSLAELNERVRALVAQCDDGWLVTTAFCMVEDLYKSFFRDFSWSPGVHDYIAATAQVVMDELSRRGFTLHYVVDCTQPDVNLAIMLADLPKVFHAAGLAVVGCFVDREHGAERHSRLFKNGPPLGEVARGEDVVEDGGQRRGVGAPRQGRGEAGILR